MIRINKYKCDLCASVILKKYSSATSKKHAFLSTTAKCDEFAPGYVPSAVEKGKYERWEKELSNALPAKNDKTFTMIMPPPNITGTLHLGHALTLTIQDVLMRWHRMTGSSTHWIPGLDHAGIATQVVVEKQLWSSRKQTRHDLGRDAFQQEVWKWGKSKSDVIRGQVRDLGALPHWGREYFTMEERMRGVVNEAFVRLFDSGHIYRSDLLVNWSCVLRSAISDVEVDHMEVAPRTRIPVPGYDNPVEFGLLTQFAYRLCDGEGSGEVIVSTTRPETILGDVAVAVHPADERYAHLRGKKVMHPFRQQPIPIITDEFVDPEFGTGAVKVTPAHDPTDFTVGRRHGLPTVQVINELGDIVQDPCSNHAEFAGLKRFHARDKVVQRLAEMGLLRGVTEHPMTIPVCSRSGDVVEHLIKPQWFVNCSKMAAEAAEDVRQGRLTIEPAVFEKTWFNWLENIRAWCISRQLWWGHRIPAYYCTIPTKSEGAGVWIAAVDDVSARDKAAKKFGVAPGQVQATQDEDVLDTWFSSALLPFAVFGWPNETSDYQRLYPTSLLETGHDILFFWVARMVMLGKQLTGQLPFNKVLLHGVICDAQGRKMSKSLGNVVAPEQVIKGQTLKLHVQMAKWGDGGWKKNFLNVKRENACGSLYFLLGPVWVAALDAAHAQQGCPMQPELEAVTRSSHSAGILSDAELERALAGQRKMFPQGIPECGADALRFTLLSHNIQSHFINFDVQECYTNKLFCNKIWQSVKYTRLSHEKLSNFQSNKSTDLPLMDKWILSRLSYMVGSVNDALEKREFHNATASLKQFLYGDFCDVYVETTKAALKIAPNSEAACHVETLIKCLEISIRALAPFMPHLSQDLYHHLPNYLGVKVTDNVHGAVFPKETTWRDEQLEEDVQIALDTVTVIRRLRKLANLTAKHQPKAYIITSSPIYPKLSFIIQNLSGLHSLSLSPSSSSSVASPTLSDTVGSHGTVHLVLPRQEGSKKSSSTINSEATGDERSHLTKKIEKLVLEVGKMEKMISADGYRSKAPEKVQDGHSRKLASLKKELLKLQQLHQA